MSFRSCLITRSNNTDPCSRLSRLASWFTAKLLQVIASTVILGFRFRREFWPRFYFLPDMYVFEKWASSLMRGRVGLSLEVLCLLHRSFSMGYPRCHSFQVRRHGPHTERRQTLRTHRVIAVVYWLLRSNGSLFNDIILCLQCRNLATAVSFSHHDTILIAERKSRIKLVGWLISLLHS
jgi:hypothetical protein